MNINKPMSMSVKEYLIRTLAVKLTVNEKMIEAVVKHQFQSAHSALDINKSVEISGFGKFVFNTKKGKKKVEKLKIKIDAMKRIIDNEKCTQEARRKAEVVYGNTLEQLNLLKQAVDEL